MSDRCQHCQQVLHVECPDCGKSVKLINGKYAPHDRFTVQGSHVEWKACAAGGKVKKTDAVPLR